MAMALALRNKPSKRPVNLPASVRLSNRPAASSSMAKAPANAVVPRYPLVGNIQVASETKLRIRTSVPTRI